MLDFLCDSLAFVSNDVSLPANLFFYQMQMLQQWLNVPSSDILVCFYVSLLYRIEHLVMPNAIELFDFLLLSSGCFISRWFKQTRFHDSSFKCKGQDSF